MNTQNFNIPGGFPLETETLDEMQKAYTIFNSIGYTIGNLSIISGCVKTGNTVSNGVVYIDGEFFEFRGGTEQSRVFIKQETIRKPFENGTEPEVLFIRYVCFGNNSSSLNWVDFKRPKTALQLSEDQNNKEEKTVVAQLAQQIQTINQRLDVFVEGGAMVFWNKPAAEIPTGWREVQDWRGRMPVGFDPAQSEFDTIGKTGGEKAIQLTEDQLPEHKHSRNDDFNLFTGSAENIFTSSSKGGFDNVQTEIELAIGNLTEANVDQMREKSIGSGADVKILNPYRTVLFIEYVG